MTKTDVKTLLKKPEIQRDENGRFDRHGKTLAKTAKKTGLIKKTDEINREIDGRYKNGGARPGAGRPKGSQNKVSLQLKEAILHALDKLGGADYLVARLSRPLLPLITARFRRAA
jgi:hypothetical protein